MATDRDTADTDMEIPINTATITHIEGGWDHIVLIITVATWKTATI